ncbi:Prefoldin alpha-like, partial [Dillenia turbinata]
VAMDSKIHEKVKQCEEFVDRRLKPDLVKAIAERLPPNVLCARIVIFTLGLLTVFCSSDLRDKVFEEQKIFSDLKKNIENLEKHSVTSLTTLVNLGSEVYMQAEVPDTRTIFVDVGLGFHVEFTWSEAINYIKLREEKLARQIEEYTHLIASIKAHIKLVCEGIRELLQLQADPSYQIGFA